MATVVTNIKTFQNNARWLFSLRSWLIMKLAGKTLVVCNAEINRAVHPAVVYIKGGDQAILSNCYFGEGTNLTVRA